jgi:hypothetical protein
VTATKTATIRPGPATIQASAKAPTVTAVRNVSVSITKATSAARAYAPQVYVGIDVRVTVPVTGASALMNAPEVTVIRNAVIRKVSALAGAYDVKTALKGQDNMKQALSGDINIVSAIAARVDKKSSLRGGVPMAAKNQNFEMYIGDTHILEITVTMDDTLAGATAKWEMANNNTVLVTKQSGSGIATTGEKVFEVTINPADTQSMKAGTYRHAAEVTDAAGRVSTVATGKMTLLDALQ